MSSLDFYAMWPVTIQSVSCARSMLLGCKGGGYSGLLDAGIPASMYVQLI